MGCPGGIRCGKQPAMATSQQPTTPPPESAAEVTVTPLDTPAEPEETVVYRFALPDGQVHEGFDPAPIMEVHPDALITHTITVTATGTTAVPYEAEAEPAEATTTTPPPG